MTAGRVILGIAWFVLTMLTAPFVRLLLTRRGVLRDLLADQPGGAPTSSRALVLGSTLLAAGAFLYRVLHGDVQQGDSGWYPGWAGMNGTVGTSSLLYVLGKQTTFSIPDVITRAFGSGPVKERP
jgi:hypothetical protein